MRNSRCKDIPDSSGKSFLSSLVITLFICILAATGLNADEQRADSNFPGSCTIFTVSRGESVFFGNNEDWYDPLTYIWVEPPDSGSYGILCFGYENLYPQGGINEKGLAFDANALPRITMKKNQDGLKPYEAIVNEIIMRKCATVSEAIETAKSYDWSQCYGGRLDGQFLLADASGDAVVIGADSSGELVFTRKQEGDGFLVSTNFNRADPENRYGRYPCKRYDTTVEMLGRIGSDDDLTVESLASILDEVHAEGRKINTLYSNVFDLKKGLVYLYFWHRVDHPVTIDVADIIARNPQPARIASLFPDQIVKEAGREYRNYQRRLKMILGGWLVLMTGFVAFILFRKVRGK